MLKKLRLLAVVIAVIVFAAGCNLGNEQAEKPGVQMGKLDFETIDTNSETFKELYEQKDFQEWYEENSRKEGAFSFEKDKDRYILLSAGEKNSEGYYLDDITLTGKEDEIQAAAKLMVPSNEEAVVHTVTYPQALLLIAGDDRKLTFPGFQEEKYQVKREVLTGTGEYVGQIDSNSVEIEVDGAPTAFRLDAPLKENFEERFGLQSGDRVSFTYIVDEYQRNVLKEITKL